MFLDIVIYILAFVFIWFGAGIAIRAVEKLSSTLKISSFAISFLVLGFFTSLSELSVGVNSIIDNNPEIYVGNLIGASIVIFMMIVPLLAIVRNKLVITKQFHGFNLLYSLVVIAAPVILALDGYIDLIDSFICIVAYFTLVIFIQKKQGLLERFKVKKISHTEAWISFLKIGLGTVIIFVGSKVVVDQTIFFSEALGFSSFLLSLLLISIGTNLPELSIIVRSVFSKNTDVAFGDYVGSAAFNTFLMGFLTWENGERVALTNSYVVSLLFLIVGLGSFYYFARTRNVVTRVEGLALLSLYIVFLMVELLIH